MGVSLPFVLEFFYDIIILLLDSYLGWDWQILFMGVGKLTKRHIDILNLI
jgi:hypothetical protein